MRYVATVQDDIIIAKGINYTDYIDPNEIELTPEQYNTIPIPCKLVDGEFIECDFPKIEIEVLEASFENAQIATGSYTGTGTYGSGNKNTLSFDFEPKFVIVFKSAYSPSYSPQSSESRYNGERQEFLYGGGVFCVQGGSNYEYTRYSMNGKTLSWYTEYSGTTAITGQMMQMNAENETYHYIAIG